MAAIVLPLFSRRLLLRVVRAAACLTLLLLLAASAQVQAVHAQALPTATGPGSRIEVGAGLSAFDKQYGSPKVGGTNFHVDLYPHWRYGLVGEANFLNQHTSQDVTLSTYMVGLKVALRPRPARLEPYANMMVGKGHIVLPYHYATGDFLAYAPGGGLDVSLGDWIKVRAFDFEYQRWPDFPFGNFHPYGVTTGVILRLTPYHRYPEGNPRSNRIPR